MRKRSFVLVLMGLVMMFLSACEFQRNVSPSEVGALFDRNEFDSCLSPGVYTEWGWFEDIKTYSVETLTFEVHDPEVATANNQFVGVRFTVQVRRGDSCDATQAYFKNWTRLLDDAIFQDTVDATAREGLKNAVRGFKIESLLDDRNGLALSIQSSMQEDMDKYFAELVNVTVEEVSVSPEFADTMQQAAMIPVQKQLQLDRQELIEQQAATDLFEREQQQRVLAEQFKVEQAQTALDVEIAERAGAVAAASQKVYQQNEQAFVLEKLRLLAEVVGDNWVFIDPTADLTLLLSGEGMTVLPVAE